MHWERLHASSLALAHSTQCLQQRTYWSKQKVGPAREPINHTSSPPNGGRSSLGLGNKLFNNGASAIWMQACSWGWLHSLDACGQVLAHAMSPIVCGRHAYVAILSGTMSPKMFCCKTYIQRCHHVNQMKWCVAHAPVIANQVTGRTSALLNLNHVKLDSGDSKFLNEYGMVMASKSACVLYIQTCKNSFHAMRLPHCLIGRVNRARCINYTDTNI